MTARRVATSGLNIHAPRLQKVREMTPLSRFVYYIDERYHVRARRLSGETQERWTQDPILSTYKFTNVRRAWDYTSTWLTTNWYKPFGQEEPMAGLAACVARWICYVPSLALIGFPNRVRTGSVEIQGHRYLDRVIKLLTRQQQSGHKVFTSAYMINAAGSEKGSAKIEFVMNNCIRPVWELVPELRCPEQSISHNCDKWHTHLRDEFKGWGDFMTQEVCLDLMETFVLGQRPKAERDQYGYAGPGAIRGLHRIGERAVTATLKRELASEEMRTLHSFLTTSGRLPESLANQLTVHDVEFNLCEFDKYERTLWSEGTPKQLYTPRSAELILPL